MPRSQITIEWFNKIAVLFKEGYNDYLAKVKGLYPNLDFSEEVLPDEGGGDGERVVGGRDEEVAAVMDEAIDMAIDRSIDKAADDVANGE